MVYLKNHHDVHMKHDLTQTETVFIQYINVFVTTCQRGHSFALGCYILLVALNNLYPEYVKHYLLIKSLVKLSPAK